MCALVVALVAVCASSAVAAAAPLSETEPNDDALHANGPFGPDGFTQTINVSDDVDYFIFRLQGRRQVAMTGTAVSDTCSVTFSSADGDFARDFYFREGESSGQTTWTTPRDATEYVGYVSNVGSGDCSGRIKVTPGDALITGPLPAPSYPRSLNVTAPAQVATESDVRVVATGVAADDDQVAAELTTGGCDTAPPDGSDVEFGSKLAAGDYNVPLTLTAPSEKGVATLCTWLYDTLGKLDPLLRQQTVGIGMAPPAPAPVVPPGSSAPPPPFAAKLEVARARVLRSARRLSVLAPITGRASGSVKVAFRAAGRTIRFVTGVDASHHRVLIDHGIPRSQARLGTGIVTLTYGGDSDTQPQTVRLRAAARKANLDAGRPQISNGRLTAQGTISSRARGVVRLQLLYEPAGSQTRTLQYTAPISNGRYSFDVALPADVVSGIASRRGVVHSYTLFTGYERARMRGEMRSYQVLPAP